jgi:ribosomal protein S18 acetylase RimI-like enzyme
MYIHTSNGQFIIRKATPDDLEQLVHVHVRSWNATYPNHHPKPTPETRTGQWQKRFNGEEENWFCFIAQNGQGEIAGFATGNNFSDAGLPYKGTLDKIHFLKMYQRLGLGRLLVAKVAGQLLKIGIDSMILFADPNNPNIRFYERLGGQRLLDENGVFHGAYGWKDINPLLKV